MAVKNDTFLNGNPPMAGDSYLNSVKDEINNLIYYFLDLDPSDREQQMQAVLTANLGGLNAKPLEESTSTDYKLVFNSFKKASFPMGFTFFEGMTIWLNNTITNTGPVQITILDRGPFSVFNSDGEQLEAGELGRGLQKLVYKTDFNGFYLDKEIDTNATLPNDFLSGFDFEILENYQDKEIQDFIIERHNKIVTKGNDFIIPKNISLEWEENIDKNDTSKAIVYKDTFPAMSNYTDGVNNIFATTYYGPSTFPYHAFNKNFADENKWSSSNVGGVIQCIGRNNPENKKIKYIKFLCDTVGNFNENVTKVEIFTTNDEVASGIDANLMNNYNWQSKGVFNLRYDQCSFATIEFEEPIVDKNIVIKCLDKMSYNGSNVYSFIEILFLSEVEVKKNEIEKGALVSKLDYSYFDGLTPMTSEGNWYNLDTKYYKNNEKVMQFAFGTSQYDTNRPIWKCFTKDTATAKNCWISGNNTSNSIVGRNNPFQKEIKGIRVFRGVRTDTYPTKIKVLATNDNVRYGINANLETDYEWVDLGDIETGFTSELYGQVDYIFDEPNNYHCYAFKVIERQGAGNFDSIHEIQLLQKNNFKVKDIDFVPIMLGNQNPNLYLIFGTSQNNTNTNAFCRAFDKKTLGNTYYWRAIDNVTQQGIGFKCVHKDLKFNKIQIERSYVSDTYPTKIEVFGCNYNFTQEVINDLFVNEAYNKVSLGQYETGFTGVGQEILEIDLSDQPHYNSYLIRVIERVGNYDIIEKINLYGTTLNTVITQQVFNNIVYNYNINKQNDTTNFDCAISKKYDGSDILENEKVSAANYKQISPSGVLSTFSLNDFNDICNFEAYQKNYDDFIINKGQAKSSDNQTEIITEGKFLKTDCPLRGFVDEQESSFGNDKFSILTAAYTTAMTANNTPKPFMSLGSYKHSDANYSNYWRIRDKTTTGGADRVYLLYATQPVVAINNPYRKDIYAMNIVNGIVSPAEDPKNFVIYGTNSDLSVYYNEGNGYSPLINNNKNIELEEILNVENTSFAGATKTNTYDFGKKTNYEWYVIKFLSGNSTGVGIAHLDLMTKTNINDTLLYLFAIKNLDNENVNFAVDTDINGKNILQNEDITSEGFLKIKYIGGIRYGSNSEIFDKYFASVKIDSGGQGLTDEFYRYITPDYTKQISQSKNTTYTAINNGILYIEFLSLIQSTDRVVINGKTYTISISTTGNTSRNQTHFHIKKGDVYYVSNSPAVTSVSFIPYSSI